MLSSTDQLSESVTCIYSFSLWFITGYGIQLPVLYSMTLLFIHPIHKHLHLLIGNSQSAPPPPLVPWRPQVWSLSVSLFLFRTEVHLCRILDPTHEWYSDGTESTCSAGDLDSIPGLWRSPEEGMATHSSILAWRIPWTEEPGGLQSMESQRVGHNWVAKHSTHGICSVTLSFN